MTAASFTAAIGAVVWAAVLDARSGYIPDILTRCAACTAFAIACFSGTLAGAVRGAAAVAGSLLVLFCLTRGRGLGFGDVKLGVVIGAGCGIVPGLIAVGAAFCLGALYAIPLLIAGRARRRDAVPFAPFLAAGTVVAAAVAGVAA